VGGVFSGRSGNIPPFIVMEILEKAMALEKEGRDIIHMEVGEPDFDTPDCIKQAACRALQEGSTHYTSSLGLPELREAVALHYREKYGVDIDPERVVVTSGTSPALLLVYAALLDPGDEIILSDPGYACYPNMVEFVDGKPVRVPVFEEDGFAYRHPDIAARLSPRTRGIMINSPSNPTGNLLDVDTMRDIASLSCRGLYVISDEIYHGLVYEGKEHSILEFTDHAFVVNGFSKLYAMTGWRLGYLIAPLPFVRPIQKMQQNLFISANSFVQHAGIAALREAGPDVERMRLLYDQRRRLLLEGIKRLGFGVRVEPQGAFYVLANARAFTSDSYAFALELLEGARVAVTPGIDFGKGGEGYIRFSYTTSLENIQEGLERLSAYLEGRR
jgi:aspartate/methionine/tyrosine aminotransferase